MSTAISTTTKLMTAEEFYDWANRPENAKLSLAQLKSGGFSWG